MFPGRECWHSWGREFRVQEVHRVGVGCSWGDPEFVGFASSPHERPPALDGQETFGNFTL